MELWRSNRESRFTSGKDVTLRNRVLRRESPTACGGVVYLVTNLATSSAALEAYRLRAHIETFFSDQKSRGFHLDRSHLSDPVRLARLMCASCLAYLWIIYLGTWGRSAAWRTRIHRGDRCDLSLFQLGLRLLSYCLRHTCAIPKGCLPPALLPTEPGEKAHTCSVG